MKTPHRTTFAIALPILFSACLSFAQTTAATNTLVISGDIPAPITLKVEDIAAMPHESATVTEEDGSKVVYEGVPLRDILTKAGAPLGKQLRGKTSPATCWRRPTMAIRFSSVSVNWTRVSAIRRFWSPTSATENPCSNIRDPCA